MIKIMIVDDLEPIRRKFIQAIANDSELQLVGEASSGEEAILLAQETSPDVILMDIEMESSYAGIYASRSIYSYLPYVKIIILTVHDTEAMIYKAFQCGIVDYIVKNSSTEEIMVAIKQAYYGEVDIKGDIAKKLKIGMVRQFEEEQSLIYVINILTKLTPTELDLLRLLEKGLKRKDIAKLRCVEENTIKNQISNILKKFELPRIKDVLNIMKKARFFELIKG